MNNRKFRKVLKTASEEKEYRINYSIESNFMTIRNFIFISLLVFPMISNCQQPDTGVRKVIIEDVRIQDIQYEDIQDFSPPSHLIKFKTIQDWLKYICDSNKPRKSIEHYSIGLLETSGQKMLYLVGQNRYTEWNSSELRTEFGPGNMYFPLSKKEYGGLTSEQIVEKLMPELKEFTNTEKFKTSFLAKANSIEIAYKGVIWSK
jgi:hypothetical protein